MAPFDRSYMTYCWSAILGISIALSYHFRVVLRFDFEIWVKGHSRSLKIVPFESLGVVSYSSSIATMAISLAVSEIFGEKMALP